MDASLAAGSKASSLPCEQALSAELVAVSSLRPCVWGVDGRVAVHVSAVLVSETVDTKALQARMHNTCRRQLSMAASHRILQSTGLKSVQPSMAHMGGM